jgi:hypothetical protein
MWKTCDKIERKKGIITYWESRVTLCNILLIIRNI